MAHVDIDIESIRRLVANRLVGDFVKRLELRNYQRCSRAQQEEIATMYQKAFDLLTTSGTDRTSGEHIIHTIVHDLFRKDDPDRWFRRFYDGYGAMKGSLEFDLIKPYIKGNTILDVGCGRGHLALKCSQEGHTVLMTDVRDYRMAEARDLPCKLMRDQVTIPYPDDAADTTLLFTVLHHVDASDLEKMLCEIRRVGSRVVIKEDVYGIPLDHEEFARVIEEDELLQEFMLLSYQDQLQVLSLHDFVDNAFAQGIPDMNFPFQFKTIPEWNRVLVEHGFVVRQTVLIGFKRTKEWTGTCHALFIADCA